MQRKWLAAGLAFALVAWAASERGVAPAGDGAEPDGSPVAGTASTPAGAGRSARFPAAAQWLLPGAANAALAQPSLLATIPLGTAADAVAVGDVNGDGRDDIVMTAVGAGDKPETDYRVNIFLNQADGQFAAPVRVSFPVTPPPGRTGLALAQVDGDGVLDIVLTHRMGLSLILGNRDGTFVRQYLHSASAGPMLTFDADLDGRHEVVKGIYNSNLLTRYESDGAGGLPVASNHWPRQIIRDLRAGDLNSDGHPDLITLGDAGTELLLNDRSGTYPDIPATSVAPDAGEDASALAVGDFNGDGADDVVLAGHAEYSPVTRMYLFPQVGGQLAAPTTWQIPEHPLMSLAADMDGDGRDDLLMVHYDRTLRYYRQGPAGFEPAAALQLPDGVSHNPRALAVADLDGNGCRDIVVGGAALWLVPGPACGAWTPVPSTPTLSISDARAAESAGSMGFTLTISSPAADPIGFTVETAAGSATENVDYARHSITGTIAAGATSAYVTVPLYDDHQDEPDETFELRIVQVQGGTIGDGVATGTILDNDAPPADLPALTIHDAYAIEGSGATPSTIVFAYTLSRAAPQETWFFPEAVGGTATVGIDYVRPGSSISIPAGATSGSFAVTVRGDVQAEFDETFVLRVREPYGLSLADGEATGTIGNDDGAPLPLDPNPPSLTVDDVAVYEGAPGTRTRMLFTVRQSRPSSRPTTFAFAANPGTVSMDDYLVESDDGQYAGIVTIPVGATVATAEVFAIGDDVVEDDETFGFQLQAAENATIEDSIGIGTIRDDDAPVLSVSDAAADEGAAGARRTLRFPVRLTRAAIGPTTFRYDLVDRDAAHGADFVGSNGTRAGLLTIAAGTTTGYVDVVILGDVLEEGDERFDVVVSQVQGVKTGDLEAVGTIRDDDVDPNTPPGISVDDLDIVEGDDYRTGFFRFRLSKPASSPVTFYYVTTAGTAQYGTDYSHLVGGQVIPAGERWFDVPVAIYGNRVPEHDETFTMTITDVHGATILDGHAVATIRNDDGPVPLPTLSIDDAEASEGGVGAGSMLVFTVRMSEASPYAASFTVATSDGSAKSGNDYLGRDVRVTIPAGETGHVFSVPILGDRGLEGDETFSVQLSDATGATILFAQANGTIRDDDAPRTSRPLPREPVPGKGGTSSDVEPVTEACAFRKWNRAEADRCARSVSARWTTSYRRLHGFLSGQAQ